MLLQAKVQRATRTLLVAVATHGNLLIARRLTPGWVAVNGRGEGYPSQPSFISSGSPFFAVFSIAAFAEINPLNLLEWRTRCFVAPPRKGNFSLARRSLLPLTARALTTPPAYERSGRGRPPPS